MAATIPYCNPPKILSVKSESSCRTSGRCIWGTSTTLTGATAPTGGAGAAATGTEESLPVLVAALDPVDWSAATAPPVPVAVPVAVDDGVGCVLFIPLLVLVVALVRMAATFPAAMFASIAVDDDDVVAVCG